MARASLPVFSSRRGRLAPQSKARPDGHTPLSRFRLLRRPFYLPILPASPSSWRSSTRAVWVGFQCTRFMSRGFLFKNKVF
jgi:hypothetical protein